MAKRSGQTKRITKRSSAKLPEPETLLGLDTLGSCGKCGAKLPVVTKKVRGVKIYSRRHLCFVCEPETGAP